MFRTVPELDESPIEATARQYARLGWSVTSRSAQLIAIERGGQTARIVAQPDGQILVEGASLGRFELNGRQQAWRLLLAMLAAALAVAWLLGWLR